MQKILTMTTSRLDLRAKVESWGAEDGDVIIKDKHISCSPGLLTPSYPTVMHAIADGWKLLAPPVANHWNQTKIWDWWLVKESRVTTKLC